MNIDEFWALVKRSEGCWEWQGPSNDQGYGYAKVEGVYAGGTHRIAFILTYGYVLPKMHICHKCDNPPCCRPDHLFVGSASDNSRDMIRKGLNWKPGQPPRKVYVAMIKPNNIITIVDLGTRGRHVVCQGKTLCGYEADPSWPVITPAYMAFWQSGDCRRCVDGLMRRDRKYLCHKWQRINNPIS